MKPKSTLRPFLLGYALLATSTAFAADATWNVNDDGNWAVNGNWNPDSAPGATTGTASTDTATFGNIINAARGITVDANRNIFGINFSANSSAYNLSGGNLLLTNDGTIQTSGGGSGHSDTISSPIVIQGDGGSAFFTGGSSTAGRLLALSGGVTGVSSGLNVTTLTLGGGNTGGNAVNGPIGNGSGGGKVAIVKSGAGTWNLTNASNSYSGGITISGGQLRITSDAALGDASNNITFTGTGALLASQNNVSLPATRTITVNAGAIAVLGDTNINNNPVNFTVAGQITGAGGVQSGHYQLGSGQTFFTNTGNNFTGELILGRSSVYGAFLYSSHTLNIASLADGEGYGNIVFGPGNNAAENTASFSWSNAAISSLILNNRRIQLDANVEGAKLANNNSNTGITVTVNTDLLVSRNGNKPLILGGLNAGNNTFAGLIANRIAVIDEMVTTTAVIGLTKQDGGIWIVSNNSNSYTGATTISGGTLSVGTIGDVNGGNTALGNPSSAANGRILMGLGNVTGTLLYTGAAASTDRTIQINSSNNINNGGAAITNNGTGALTFTAATFNEAYVLGTASTRTLTLNGTNGGSIAGTIQNNSDVGRVAVTKSHAGTWILSGDNTYTGNTTIGAGTLLINGDQSLATGAVAVNGTSTLGGSGTIGGNVTIAGDANLAPGASVGTLAIGGNLTISAMAGGEGTLIYELGPIAASDKIAVTGTLNIGTGALGLSDFDFTNVGGLQEGIYTLVTSGGLTGTLADGDSAGTIGAFGAELQISGNNLVLAVGDAGLAGYALWASVNAPSGGPDADFDGDGVSNALEFVLGGDKNTNDLGKLPMMATSGGNLLFTFVRDQQSIDGSTTVQIEVGTDLATWPATFTVGANTAGSSAGVTVTKNSQATGHDTVTLTVPRAPDAKKFARLKVLAPP